jgi:hypothetical protein
MCSFPPALADGYGHGGAVVGAVLGAGGGGGDGHAEAGEDAGGVWEGQLICVGCEV